MKHKVLCGLDRVGAADGLLKGRRVGLMTNQTGIDSRFRSAIDRIAARYRLTALFAVEHGIRGDAQAGESYETRPDPVTGAPVYAVYGKTRRLTADMLDAFDVLIFDMQDVGARFYTYLYALSFAMEECARAGKPVVVLDRVNPLGGERVEGTVLSTRFASYVGMYPLPTRYGLTIGEYALWVKNRLRLDLDLTVVPLRGWKRAYYLDDLEIPWVAPSPNCATFHAALVYPGCCVFEGVNVSEGRGTTLPFEYIGAPWIDARALEKRMAARALPGLHFRAHLFQVRGRALRRGAGARHRPERRLRDRGRADAAGRDTRHARRLPAMALQRAGGLLYRQAAGRRRLSSGPARRAFAARRPRRRAGRLYGGTQSVFAV